MVNIRYYSPGDSLRFKFRDKQEIKNIMNVYPAYFYHLNRLCEDNVFCICVDGEPVVIAGWATSPLVSGCEMFMFASEKLNSVFGVEVFKCMKKIVNMATAQCDRLSAFCRADNEMYRRFLERLGFEQEGAHPGYGLGGCDMLSFGLLRREL